MARSSVTSDTPLCCATAKNPQPLELQRLLFTSCRTYSEATASSWTEATRSVLSWDQAAASRPAHWWRRRSRPAVTLGRIDLIRVKTVGPEAFAQGSGYGSPRTLQASIREGRVARSPFCRPCVRGRRSCAVVRGSCCGCRGLSCPIDGALGPEDPFLGAVRGSGREVPCRQISSPP